MCLPELQTPRLLLRSFRLTDIDDALAYRNDEEFARYMPHIPQPFTRKDAEEFVAVNMAEPWRQSPTFAVVFDGKVIGTVNFKVNAETRSAMLGYAIGREWWGQGLAFEAVSAAVTWASSTFRLTRLWAACDPLNARSIRLMQRLGMKQESLRDDGQPVFALTLSASFP